MRKFLYQLEKNLTWNDKYYKVGDTVKVGKVEYTLKSVTTTSYRNEFADEKPKNVIKVIYHVKNDSKKDVSKKQGITVYEVKAGDTLESIAKKYKTSTKKLKIISKKSKKVLSIGDKIEIVK